MKKLLLTKYSFILSTLFIINISCNAPVEKAIDIETPSEVMSTDATETDLLTEPVNNTDSLIIDTSIVSESPIKKETSKRETEKTDVFEKKGNAIIHKSKDQALVDSIKAEKNKYK